jgi:hypothetical protein
MVDKSYKLPETEQLVTQNRDKSRKPYYIPHLDVLGDLRTLTLGSSVYTEFESFGAEGFEWVRY